MDLNDHIFIKCLQEEGVMMDLFNIEFKELILKSKLRKHYDPRQVISFILRRYYLIGAEHIALFFNRHRTNAYNMVEKGQVYCEVVDTEIISKIFNKIGRDLISNQCHSCIHSSRAAGSSHHLQCNFFTDVLFRIGLKDPIWKHAPRGSEHGVNSGWYTFPVNYDTEWMREPCRLFKI